MSEAIEDMLQNWGRWARLRQTQGHCASIEWRYRSKMRPDETPTGWGDWLTSSPLPPMPALDSLQALAVEGCMRHMPDGHRKALKLRYVLQMPRRMICLRLSVNKLDYDRYMNDARAMIGALFTRQAKGYIRDKIRLPVLTETLAPERR